MDNEEAMRQAEEGFRALGSMIGRGYRAALTAAMEAGGMDEATARIFVMPIVLAQFAAIMNQGGMPDPERGFLDWLQRQTGDDKG